MAIARTHVKTVTFTCLKSWLRSERTARTMNGKLRYRRQLYFVSIPSTNVPNRKSILCLSDCFLIENESGSQNRSILRYRARAPRKNAIESYVFATESLINTGNEAAM